jgi:hypothetical protein
MKNLQISEEDRAKQVQPANPALPQYPYGLCLNLDEMTLKKLGVTELPEIGKSLIIKAKVEVTARSEYESKEGGESRSLALQITDMEIQGKKREISPDRIYDYEQTAGKTYGKLSGEEKVDP